MRKRIKRKHEKLVQKEMARFDYVRTKHPEGTILEQQHREWNEQLEAETDPRKRERLEILMDAIDARISQLVKEIFGR